MTLMFNIGRAYASVVAHALRDKIHQMDVADFEERETYGYGPIITCDSDEARASISRVRSEAWDALNEMASQGIDAARRTLGYMREDSERRMRIGAEALKNAPAHGTKVRFKTPYGFVNHRNNHLIRKRGGTFLDFVVSPDCEVIYKVKIKKGMVVNQRPDEVEVA